MEHCAAREMTRAAMKASRSRLNGRHSYLMHAGGISRRFFCNRELAALVKLILKTEIDGKIYGEEYNRIGKLFIVIFYHDSLQGDIIAVKHSYLANVVV